MSLSKYDAINDMKSEGLDVSRQCNLGIDDIVDPIVEYGFTPSQRDFINFAKKRCDALGSMVLGVGRELEFPERYTPRLLACLSSDYCVSKTFLEGIEAGFAGWSHFLSLPCFVGKREFRKGYMVGWAAWKNLICPPTQPGSSYMA
jgi:hypothetical protein